MFGSFHLVVRKNGFHNSSWFRNLLLTVIFNQLISENHSIIAEPVQMTILMDTQQAHKMISSAEVEDLLNMSAFSFRDVFQMFDFHIQGTFY